LIAELFRTFFRIGAFTFGGGYAMISILDHECVEKKKWITSEELMNVTVIAESTPGPVAINCATFTGYKMAGVAGAVAATVGVVLPSLFVIFLISQFFENLLTVPVIARIFRGIRAGVAVLMINVAVKMFRGELASSGRKVLSSLFAAVFFAALLVSDILGLNFSTAGMIVIAGIAGWLLYGMA